MSTGTVLYGINNIFTVRTKEGSVECRIKGKTLKNTEGEHNPLAPGDRVDFERDKHNPGYGMITRRLDRKNAFTRWNRKKQRIQTIAANLDCVACVSSSANPPFRPRFIDRVIIESERAGIPVIIIMNKSDLPLTDEAVDRVEDFIRIGYTVFTCSALTGEGLDDLAKAVYGKSVVFFGQSGVGKSTLLNRLYPDLNLKTGTVSRKYDRGAHTTVFSVLIPRKKGGVIDTPGIREIETRGLNYIELSHLFREFWHLTAQCTLRNCRHLDEPGCAIREAVETGRIHPDRYESYRTILLGMEG